MDCPLSMVLCDFPSFSEVFSIQAQRFLELRTVYVSNSRKKEEDSLCRVDTNGAHASIALTWLLNHPMEYCLRFVSSEISLYSSCFHISRITVSKESTMADIQLALVIRHCRKISHQNIPFSLTLEVENEFIVNHA